MNPTKQLPDGPKAFYKQVKSAGVDIHVIFNFGSHRVDADLSFGENCDGLRDDYIENIIREAAEHAVTCINEYARLVSELDRKTRALERIAELGSRDGLSDIASTALQEKNGRIDLE